jgi:hypothetical protein
MENLEGVFRNIDFNSEAKNGNHPAQVKSLLEDFNDPASTCDRAASVSMM